MPAAAGSGALLVVGSRSRGLTGTLLGSVSAQVTTHATGPWSDHCLRGAAGLPGHDQRPLPSKGPAAAW